MIQSLISHLDHVGLRVPDPEAAADFYVRVLGLGRTGTAEVDGGLLLSVRPGAATTVSHHDLALYRADEVGIDHLGFAVSAPDPGPAAAALRSAGVQLLDGGRPGAPLRLQDPDGLLVELMVPGPRLARPPGPSAFDIVKLGHVTQRSPEPGRQSEFWCGALQFRVSDRIDENFFWLRCNRDHHSMAWVRADRPGNHHVALEVGTWEDIKLACDHLSSEGVPVEYGPCRHGPGNNTAVYFRDPWGIRWELFTELERVEDERPAKVWTGGRQNTINLWGPLPAESYYV